MKLKNSKVLIAGFGRTGEAVCRFLLDQGAQIKISEKRPLEEIQSHISSLARQGVEVEAGGHQRNSFLEAELIIPSPGIPMIPELAAAQELGIPIMSEVELASRHLRGRIIGITGSNGKSTVTTLIHKILKDSGVNAQLAGNIGIPLISYVKESRKDCYYVTELSSFQLEHTLDFSPYIALLLNVTPDHLNWHGGFDSYYAAKKKLFANMTESQNAVLNRDDPLSWDMHENAKYRVYGFSRKHTISPGCGLQEQRLVFFGAQEEDLMDTADIPIPGIHNQENVMAAALAARIVGVSSQDIRTCVMAFKGLEHRLEKVMTLKGVDVYNDSKATNVDAVLKAVKSFDKKIIIILGGRNKGGDFISLRKPLKAHAKKAILIGEAADRIQADLEGILPLEKADSLKAAVRLGFESSLPGDILLLAPACTSFDMFDNFEQRGRIFKQEVKRLQMDWEVKDS